MREGHQRVKAYVANQAKLRDAKKAAKARKAMHRPKL